MMKLVHVCVLLAAVVMVAGCETVKGVGKDITNAGTYVQEKI